MSQGISPQPSKAPQRRDRELQEFRPDAYRSKTKYAEPTVCPDCQAVYHAGRWQWLSPPADAEAQRCPACQRAHDHYPAGYLSLSGKFLAEHHGEIMQLIQNIADRARAEHPIKKIIDIDEEAVDSVLVSTAEIHLARELGEAIHRAYKGGELDYHYNSGDNLLRVTWKH
jgi:NMD protein affecting ribosome stability and mRNA decay